MTLDATPEGALVLTMSVGNVLENGSKERTAKSVYRFTRGKGRASTITEMASTFSPHEAASMLTIIREQAPRRDGHAREQSPGPEEPLEDDN